MNKEEYLRIVRKHIHYVFDRSSIEMELKGHIEDSIQDFIEEGFSREEAEEQAVGQMGNPEEVGKMLNKEHHPLLGYIWMATNIVLILFALVLPISILMTGYISIKMVVPIEVENSVEIIPLDIDLDMSTHRIKIDNICLDEEGQYSLTYRAWTKFDYSRAGWSSDLFYIKNSYGEYLPSGRSATSSVIGSFGAKDFDWPKDNVLWLRCKDGKEIRIDLKEYSNEKR